MSVNFSRENILQWAFALSPFPAYLPQYFSMMKQLTTVTEGGGSQSAEHDDFAGTAQASVAVERGGDHLRKRNLIDSPTTMHKTMVTAATISSGGVPGLSGIGPTPIYEPIGIVQQNGSFEERETNNKLDAGLSRMTVLLLLSAHLIRLLYFHGLLLEESRPVPPRASAGDELDELLSPPSAAAVPEASKSAIQWDLLGQSLSMIIVQLMLLHAMMLFRRKLTKIQRKRMSSDFGIDGQHPSSDSLSSSTMPEPPRSSSSFVMSSSLEGTDHMYNHNNSPTALNDNKSFWQKKWHHCSRATTAHFHHLLSPHNILQKHSFLEYLELLFLCSMVVKLIFDYHWYPMYRMQVVEWLKHTSIALESCLALPQAIRNYRKGTTEGLSVVMVGGWVSGDFFKLCYFLYSMIGVEEDDDESNNVGVFALGCVVAIALDTIVGLQMALWYPQPETIEWQERIMRSVRHWKTNKDDDAGESLLINSSGQKKDGLIVSIVRKFFQWARGIRPASNAS